MTNEANIAKHVIHDKLKSQITTAEAKLDTLKARAETAKANAEIKAIGELLIKRQVIHERLAELKNASGAQFEHAKADLESRIAEFEKSVRGIETKAHAN